MKFDPQKHHRRSIRLKEYDYSAPGAYFITTLTWRCENNLGEVRDGRVALSEYGRVVVRAWLDLPRHYPHVKVDAFVVMPNHVHGIIVLDGVGAGLLTVRSYEPSLKVTTSALHPDATQTCPYGGEMRHGLGEVVRAFKSYSARRINRLRGTAGQPVWQRNYYERVVRNERELDAIRAYIRANPQHWEEDS